MIHISWSSDYALYFDDYLIRELSYIEYKFHVTQRLTSKYMHVSVTYISWSSDFFLYFKEYLMEKYHTMNVTKSNLKHICRSL